MKKQNEQKRTKLNIIDGYELFSNLEPRYQEAILKRLDGWRINRIAREMGYEYITIRQWFMTDGKCFAAYEGLVKIQQRLNKKKSKKMNKMLEEAAPEMLESLIASGKTGDTQAAIAVLDRAGYTPTQKLEVKQDSGDKEQVQELIKALRERVKNKDKSDNIK